MVACSSKLEYVLVLVKYSVVYVPYMFCEFLLQLPVILALLGVWYHNFYGADSFAILPYDQVPSCEVIHLNILYKFLTFLCYQCSTCIVLRRTSNKATWSRTESRSHAVARESTTLPVRSCGENPAPTANTPSTSSSTKARQQPTRAQVFLCTITILFYSKVNWWYFLGTRVIPCDFLAPIKSHNPISGGLHHQVYWKATKCTNQ